MSRTSWSWSRWGAGVAALTVVLAACSGGDEEPPTAAEFAERLLVADDLGDGWSVSPGPPGDDAIGPDGVVSDEAAELLPTVELCEAASATSRAAADGLRPLAFRQLDLAVDDPIDPPEDTVGHMVFAQEFLFADEASSMRATFDEVRDGMLACLGDFSADEEGPGTAIEVSMPDVGDDRVGVLTIMEEAGGWAEWRLYSALVLDGPRMGSVVLVDIRAGDEPHFTDAEFGEIVETAVAKW